MPMRGVRGATTTASDEREAILEATSELLAQLVEANGIRAEDLASAFFTATPDLTAAFPAEAARRLGWSEVPLMGAKEQAVAGAPERCIRVLLHWNTATPQAEVRHAYLRGAERLRADLAR